MKIFAISSLFILSILGWFNMGLLKNIFSRKNKTYSVTMNVETKGSLYDYKLNDLKGKAVDLSQYKGKKILLINVASKCGFTPQYADWQAFHEKYGKDVVVLGFPANNFLKQEPGSNADIEQFCQLNYGVSFQMFEKISVAGKDKHPLYQWLSTKSLNGWNDQEPSWNFCKYLVNEEGKLTHFFESNIKPNSAEFKKAIGI